MKVESLPEKSYTAFLPIKGYEGYYVIDRGGVVKSVPRVITDSLGRVRNLQGRIRSIAPDTFGFSYVNLSMQGKHNKQYVHRLVAETWVENDDPKTKIHVRHIDGNKRNNHASNLMWVKSSPSADYVYRSTRNNRRYALKVNPKVTEKLVHKVLKKQLSVTEAIQETGYSLGYGSILLRKRAKELGLLDRWHATVRIPNRDKSREYY